MIDPQGTTVTSHPQMPTSTVPPTAAAKALPAQTAQEHSPRQTPHRKQLHKAAQTLNRESFSSPELHSDFALRLQMNTHILAWIFLPVCTYVGWVSAKS